MQTLLADAVLGFHFLFIVFVVGGQACILIGGLLGWCWVRNLGFRIAHLLAISVVVVESWIGTICPLTIWEVTLRRMGGETTLFEVTRLNRDSLTERITEEIQRVIAVFHELPYSPPLCPNG